MADKKEIKDLQEAVNDLNKVYPGTLSLGYIGNYERGEDHTLWKIWTKRVTTEDGNLNYIWSCPGKDFNDKAYYNGLCRIRDFQLGMEAYQKWMLECVSTNIG